MKEQQEVRLEKPKTPIKFTQNGTKSIAIKQSKLYDELGDLNLKLESILEHLKNSLKGTSFQ